MKRYALRVGEYLAIAEDAVRHDADGFFILLGGGPAENTQHGSVTIVNIRGALQQFKDEGGDSYESILERVSEAFAANPEPTSVVLRISSPGGLVAGLNECVAKLQRMSKASGIPLVAYVDELAASAAYAMCCACEEILAPKSAVIGSVGVVSTMVSCAERDKKDGIEFRLITSGKRKADGHPHVPISEDAEKAERARNAELASQFFELASKARGLSPAKLASYEAAIYLGREAESRGLIDDVISLDEALYGLDASEVAAGRAAPNTGNVTDRRANDLDTAAQFASPLTNLAQPAKHQGAPMAVKLSALIKRTEASLASETDPKKRASLQASLAAFVATRAEVDSDDDDEDKKKKDDDDDDGDDDSASSKHAKRAEKLKAKAKATEHRSKAADLKSKAAAEEEEAKKCEEEASGEDSGSEEEASVYAPRVGDAPASAALALLEQTTGRRGSAAIGAAMAKFSRLSAIEADVAKLTATAEAKELADLRARASRYVPTHLTRTLDITGLRAMVAEAEAKGSPMVATTDGDLLIPRAATPGTEEALPKETVAMIDAAVLASPVADKKAFRVQLVEAHNKAHKERLQQALNGAGRV